MSNYFRGYTYIGEAAIVVEVLHGNLAGKVAEEGHSIVGTIISSSITKGRHQLSISNKAVESLYTLSGSSRSRRL